MEILLNHILEFISNRIRISEFINNKIEFLTLMNLTKFTLLTWESELIIRNMTYDFESELNLLKSNMKYFQMNYSNVLFNPKHFLFHDFLNNKAHADRSKISL